MYEAHPFIVWFLSTQSLLNQATGDYYTFSNIRYAEPPVGALRFEAPIPPRTTDRTINNGSTSFICPQAYPTWILATRGHSVAPPPSPSENEDCLFLDVAVPRAIFNRTRAGAAVLVWIHGGGYTLGTKAGSPAGLIARSEQATGQGIIYIAMNYRLGLFVRQSSPYVASIADFSVGVDLWFHVPVAKRNRQCRAL
jgi:carboxylesterase type B